MATGVVPLNVRLSGNGVERHITRELRRPPSYRSIVPGGFASATFELDRPLTLDPAELQIFNKVVIYDGRNGNTVWQGRLEDPARGADGSGRVWKLTALGPMAHAEDRVKPLVYVDQTLDDFIETTPGSAKNGRAALDVDANNNPAIKLAFDRNYVANNTTRIGLRYRRLNEAGMKLAAINYSWDAGVTDANWTIEARCRSGLGGALDTARSDTLNVAGGALARKVVVTNWTNGRDILEFVMQSNLGASTAVPNDVYYVIVGSLVIRALLLDASGNEITTGYTADSVLASDVVKDLLGRLLPKWDGALASITASTYAIDQLMYENGQTPRAVLDDLIEIFEPNFFWAAWEDTSNGLARFEFSQWPTTVRYEASAVDGFQAPGSIADLYNEVHVRWKAGNGRVKTTIRTQNVQALTDAGLTRSTQIDLADELASAANAIQAGDQFLAQHATIPNEGTLRVSRPILDLVAQRWVQPWEIRPGNLIRVRDVKPRADALNATDRDGVTVFRVYSVDYDGSTNIASLELDSGARSYRRIQAHRGHRRVVAPKPTSWDQTHTDKQIAARRDKLRKAKAARAKSHRRHHRHKHK